MMQDGSEFRVCNLMHDGRDLGFAIEKLGKNLEFGINWGGINWRFWTSRPDKSYAHFLMNHLRERFHMFSIFKISFLL